jgi:hypothetical protein
LCLYLEPSLLPVSEHYKLAEPQSISWKTRELHLTPGENAQTIQYAELSQITIQQIPSANMARSLGEQLHTLNFSIRLRVS